MAAEVAAAASVLGAASQAKTTFYDPLRQKISNSKRLEEVHEALKYAIDSLVLIRDELEIEVQNHKARRRPSKPYITWVGKVQKIEDEVEGFETPYGVQIKKSKYWSFSSRSKLSDKMKEKASAVIRLLEEERQFRSILVDREPERVVKMTPPDIKDFPTLQRPLEQILVWLKEDEVKGIRVHGALATGKTTIMQNLNDHSQVFETFGVVIWLKVSTGVNKGNISTQELQQAIARRLMIRDINGVDEVAKAIKDSLKDKKYLLLLDDVRQDLNMDEIGIPETQAQDFLGSNVNVDKILHLLKMMLLLEEGARKRHVRMERCIRDVILFILSTNVERKYLVKTSESLREPPLLADWKDNEGISLADNDLNRLCGAFHTFSAEKIKSEKDSSIILRVYGETFRVLNLYRTGIFSLPPSFSKLVGLKMLYLNGCSGFVSLPSQIEKLEHLEVLDIRGSTVSCMPHQIGSLINLRRQLLSVTSCSGRETNPEDCFFDYKEISMLPKLEELFIGGKSQDRSKMVCRVTTNTATMKKLNILRVCFVNEAEVVIDVVAATPKINFPREANLTTFLEKIDKTPHCDTFQVFIDCKISNPQIPTPDRYNRFVKYCNGKWSDPPVFRVLDKADAVELFNHEHQFLSDFETVGMNQVQHCQVESWKNIRSIVDGGMNCLTLRNMKRLYMKDLPELESIWRGPLNGQLQSLSNLKTLVLIKCPKLIMILSDGVIQQLSKIQHLEIRECHGVEDIISVPSSVKLDPDKSLKWPSLEKHEISMCPNVNELPFTNSNPRKLASIEVDRVWWEKLNWQELQVKERLSALLPLVNGYESASSSNGNEVQVVRKVEEVKGKKKTAVLGLLAMKVVTPREQQRDMLWCRPYW
ncbi:hypothetical protein RJ640_002277 [Escallonia rubra]|uniref:Disease resistance protein n=1 Tax=Escallonia rubra TaxID=112253 RepID=A0AA88UQA7_9ASTE|nr:hypothetical protein RJ640_002277 [Escallonia rubra]